MRAILKKELKTYFLSPIGYIFIGLFLLMCSIFFYLDVVTYGSVQFESMFYSVSTILTFIIPILTMRMFAEEKRNGTNQLLFTSPKSTLQITMGKFLAATTVIIIAEVITFIYYIILSFFGGPHLQTAIVTLIGFLLLSMAYISFGMLASSITENQIIAAVLTVGFFILIWFLPNLGLNFNAISLINMFDKFPAGILGITEVIAFISFIVMCFILTIIMLKNKKNVLLILATILSFIVLNIVVQKLDLPDIDVTKDKIYTVSDASKIEVEKINDTVNIYFFGYMEDDAIVDFAKQYNKINSNIQTEVVDLNKRADLVQKYQVTDEDKAIVVECKEKQKILTEYDFYSYDYTTYEQIDLTEQKLTNAIISVTSENIPVVYFLTGHEEYGIDTHMTILKAYLENDINKIESLNLLTKENVPEDCSCLVIASPQKDFSDYETELIVKYIENGGKIVWLNDVTFENENTPNINKILNLYGIEFEQKGILLEQDKNQMLVENPSYIIPNMQSSDITKQLATDGKIAVFNSGKINFNEEQIENEGIEITNILTSNNTSFYRTNLALKSDSLNKTDEEGSFVIASCIKKKIEEGKTSTLVAFANNIFVTDYQIQIGNYSQYAISILNNKDIVLNAISYLNKKDDAITIRKDMGVVTYVVTDMQDTIIRIIIFAFPIVIILVGIIVWQKRRRKK